ncbi:YdcF family protein [Candidatus Uhrbacteria bacterium]|nr:YdcF family protein [Candidatus Uhrbacteria bacterium]
MVRMPQDIFIFTISDVPERPVALVLGASIRKGEPSEMLSDRLDTAAELYQAGKVKKIVVSGDNREEHYNEPAIMKRYLSDQGIHSGDIISDYAGRRTYDSCYRLKEIFGQQAVTIVTQRYHLVRALYLCRSLGIDAVGVGADRARYEFFSGEYARDVAASLKAWIDINFLRPVPILGKQEKVF